MDIIQVTKANFDQLLSKSEVLVLSFSAAWCKPCQTFERILRLVSIECPEAIFGIIDIEKEKELREEFKVKSVPATMILHQRTVVFAETGLLTVAGLRRLIRKLKPA